MDDEIKRSTARRKSALMLEIIQDKTLVADEPCLRSAALGVGTLGRVLQSFLLRSDNGLAFSRSYTALVCGYGLRQDHHTALPGQSGMVERSIHS